MFTFHSVTNKVRIASQRVRTTSYDGTNSDVYWVGCKCMVFFTDALIDFIERSNEAVFFTFAVLNRILG